MTITYLTDYFRYGWQLLNGVRARGELENGSRRQRDLADFRSSDDVVNVLDLANGRLAPQYLILKAAGHRVYGVDLVNRPSRSATDFAYALARVLYVWKLGLPLSAVARDTLVCGDVHTLPFPDDTFSLVTSVAAFEHFLDVPAVVKELYRVTASGGLIWIGIHPFACPSGGHNVSLTQVPLHSIPRGIEPWDHLRRRRLPFHVPLNEWRKGQYLEEFSKYFEILNQYCAMREGEHLLTPQIEGELSNYSRDELTCGAYVIVARKPL